MSMTPQTAGQDRGDTRGGAPDVPSQRAGEQVLVPDPLVGPPVRAGARSDDRTSPHASGSGDRLASGAQPSAVGAQTGTGGATASSGTHTASEHAGRSDLSTATTGELVKRLSTQLSELVRGELELARVELTEKGKRAGTGAGLAGAGGVVALYGVGALIAAAIAALALVLPIWLSALIVGVVLLLIGGVLALAGRSQLRRATPPVPEQAVESVHRDVETVKGAVHR